jgi:hypothetical protein
MPEYNSTKIMKQKGIHTTNASIDASTASVGQKIMIGSNLKKGETTNLYYQHSKNPTTKKLSISIANSSLAGKEAGQ